MQKADYKRWKYGLELGPIKKASQERLKSNEAFGLIRTNAEWLSQQDDKVHTLNLKKYQEEQKKIKATVKQIETLNKLGTELNVEALPEDLKKFEYDNGKSDRFKQWIKNLRSNIYLNEAVNVVNDLIVQKNVVYNNK